MKMYYNYENGMRLNKWYSWLSLAPFTWLRVKWSRVKQHYLHENHRITGPPCVTKHRTIETTLVMGNGISSATDEMEWSRDTRSGTLYKTGPRVSSKRCTLLQPPPTRDIAEPGYHLRILHITCSRPHYHLIKFGIQEKTYLPSLSKCC